MQAELSPLQSYYAARADEYDGVYQKPERQPDLRRIEQWLPSVFPGSTVLEVACGTGYWTRLIAPAAAAVVALDSAPETLRIAEQRVGARNVQFQVGDAYALPRSGRAFDAAFAGFWFSHVPIERQREFLLGLNAALDPGARVLLLDNLFVEGSSSPIAEDDAHGNTYQKRSLRDGSTHRVLQNFPTEAQLRALAQGGLGDAAAYRRWTYYWAFEYRVPGSKPHAPRNGSHPRG
jgi:demethylmenaquinone methyltransferase/2-methoxy-6-polyprenyl-1,4-benzoquinol methylase